tara:strand:- start:23 stop:523 length:501 start_codon:yes stop_codon:yes gene_type:complete
MQDKPGFVEKVAPEAFLQAANSKMAGSGATAIKDGAMDAWSALTKAPASPSTIPVSELSNTMGTAMSPSGMFGGAEGAIAAQQAAAASTVGQGSTALMGSMATGGAEAAIAAEVAAAAAAEAAAASALTGAAAGGTVAAAAPAALMAGPFAPLVLGGMMLAANSGK